MWMTRHRQPAGALAGVVWVLVLWPFTGLAVAAIIATMLPVPRIEGENTRDRQA
jgi:Na+/melibiose symporter-like transporter